MQTVPGKKLMMADGMLEGSGWLIKFGGVPVQMAHEVPDGSGADSRQSC